MGLAKRTNLSVIIILILFGLTCVLMLPGLRVGRAATTPRAASQKPQSSELDSSRQAALEKLYAQFKSGAPFAEEEGVILREFGAGVRLTDVEADVVISRALFDYYILSNELTKEQQELLARYSLSVARRSRDVADFKSQLLNRRKAAAAVAPPRITPLVAPANDACAGAEVIPAAGPFPYLTAVTGDITDATTVGDPPVPSCQDNVSRSIWYTFTPSTSADYMLSTCAFDGTSTTVEDTVMAIYTSTGPCAGPFMEIPTSGNSDGCDDDACVDAGLQAVIVTRLNGGTQYYIVVWQWDTPAPLPGATAVQLRVSQVAPPGNDRCAGAIPLSLDTPVNGTTVVAANDYQLSGSGCFTGVGQTASTASGDDVVYSFTAPGAGNYSFRVTKFDTTRNLVLYVATTCPGGAPPATVSTCIGASNRQSTSTSEEVSCVALSAGQQVFIFVDESSVTTGSSFTIEINLCVREVEPNDTPGTANTFACGIEGAINAGTDADFFSLGSPAAGSRLFAMIDGVAANWTDFDLRVTTSTDTLEYDDFNNTEPFGVLAGNVAGTLLTGVQSFLRVNQRDSAVSEPYRLYAVVQPPSTSATIETEPNNTTATANSAANNYFSGSLSGPAPSGDVDLFGFTANSGDLIFLSLDCDPARNGTPIEGALALLNSAGTELMVVNNFDSTFSTASGGGSLTATTPFSPAEGLIWRARTTGTYYAKVLIGTNSAGASGAGDYLLSISRNCSTGTTSTNATIGLYNPTTSTFFLKNSNSAGPGDIVFPYGPAGAGWTPIVGDWNGDGVDTVGLYNPTTSTFFLKNSNSAGPGDIVFPYGPAGAGWTPIVGDWNGDGIDTVGLYNPSTSTFFLKNTNSAGPGDIVFPYGPAGAGWTPIVGDWDGNGTDTVGLFNPGTSTFFLKNTNSAGPGDLVFGYGPGGAGWTPLVGDWNGDGVDTIGLYNPATGFFFLKNTNAAGSGDLVFGYGPGGAGWTPIVGDWDGL